MSDKLNLTTEQVREAVRKYGSQQKAAKAIGCSASTIQRYLGAKWARPRAPRTAAPSRPVPSLDDALAAALEYHERKIREIDILVAERHEHEEQAERIRVARGILFPASTNGVGVSPSSPSITPPPVPTQ